jgi:hypothetical protein
MAGCKKPEPPDSKNFPAPVEFTTIGQCFLYSELAENLSKKDIVITAQSEWDALKEQIKHAGCSTDDFMTAEIDFSKYQVVAVFEEIKGHSVWSIAVTTVTEYADKIVVTVTGSNASAGNDVAIQPFCMATIPVSDKKIIFEHIEDTTQYSIENVKWKLVSVVDVSNNSITIPQPIEDSCFYLIFSEDRTLYCKTTVNLLWGHYIIDYEQKFINITEFKGSVIDELYDGDFFVKSLYAVDSFSVLKQELKLYYNNGNNYLLFEPAIKNDLEIWECALMIEDEITIRLALFPFENKFFHTQHPYNEEIQWALLFGHEIWGYYILQDNIMYERFPNEEFDYSGNHNSFVITMLSQDTMEMYYSGVLPDIPIIRNYLFIRKNKMP